MTQSTDDEQQGEPLLDEPFEEHEDEDEEEHSSPGSGSALGDLAARLVRAGAGAVSVSAEKIREKGEDLRARELVSGAAVLTSKGKDELINLLATEVRSYVEKLRLGEEVHAFLTEHSLEVTASLRLKKCAESSGEAAEQGMPVDDPSHPAEDDVEGTEG